MQQAPERPNIVFVLTDDADFSLLYRMPEIKDRLITKGTKFKNAFAPFPTCCPARTTILRGQYPHNHGVKSNYAPVGGVAKFRELGLEGDNLATRLDEAGYRTGLFGKYLNEYEGGYVPPGWDTWRGWLSENDQTPTDAQVYDGKRTISYDLIERHEAEIIGGDAERFIENTGDRPFFAFVAFNSPHQPALVADRYQDAYSHAELPRRVSFDEEDVSDKPSFIQEFPRVSEKKRVEYLSRHRDRLGAMRSVDDEVADLVRALNWTGKMNNTYFVLWNDNGYHMGQHRLPPGKRTAYEEDIRYPLVVRGPDVPRGFARKELVSGTDLAPTFLDLAGVEIPPYADGRSLAPLLSEGTVAWRDAVLVEGWKFGVEPHGTFDWPTYSAVRTQSHIYVEYEESAEKEYYDLVRDPYQLQSLAGERPEEEAALQARLERLKACAMDSCREAEGP